MKNLLFLSLIFLFSCASRVEVKTQSILGDWKVTNIQNVQIPADVKSHLNFQMEEKLSGNTGCNNFFASYKVNDNKILISNSGATKKLCFGKVNNYEFLFLQALSRVDSYEIERNYLTLLSEEGKILFKADRN